ncbi:hypothetical protein [Ornithinibacillus gellani]|uniref:hypothetical protein n=1 Tax=Ornithinibacillus gellani TaxID=2293253 RepID=UPI0016815FAA|nr:hypothetical protein [Ornithinibacillus gellani]
MEIYLLFTVGGIVILLTMLMIFRSLAHWINEPHTKQDEKIQALEQKVARLEEQLDK